MRGIKSGLFFSSLVVGIICQSGSIAFAATDGTPGVTSTGDTSVSLSISNLVRISGIADMNFGTYDGSGDLAQDDDVCVWTNQSSGTYKVLAQGDGDSNAFTVSSGAGTLSYSVKWNNTTGTTGNTALTADTISGEFSGASTTSSTCSGGDTANFEVTFSAADLLAVRPATYTGVLTLVVSPSP